MNKSYYKNQKDESIKSPESSAFQSRAQIQDRDSSEESFFDIGEESVANEKELTLAQ